MRDLIRLAKGGIIFTVVVTGFTGMLMEKRTLPSLWEIFWILGSLTLSSGSSALMNNLFDYHLDQKMQRTLWRSALIDKFGKKNLWIIASCAAIFSLVPLIIFERWWAAFFTIAAIFSYAVWYTLFLKRNGPFGAIVGGLPGALPVLIGAYAVADKFMPDVWLLFAFMMLWQPAHFWALALKIQDEYAKGGIPVLPLVYGNNYTRLYILLYGFSLPPLALGVGISGGYSFVYLIAVGVASIHFLLRTIQGIFPQKKKNPDGDVEVVPPRYGRAFFASIIYMLVVMLLVVADVFLYPFFS
ncbi:MAG: Protoheme IX farnesyltransferase 1 [Turneriella sp.]|nr:Protoheme IX farnesyltransferase 1 [Turneriella sp.]